MLTRTTTILLSLLLIAIPTGCTPTGNSMADDTISGGLIGTAGGAATGAAVGAIITNGDIGESALLGSAIGLGAGLVGGVMYNAYQKQKRLDDNYTLIEQNKITIAATQREIDAYREELDIETMDLGPGASRAQKDHLFLGTSLANPYR